MEESDHTPEGGSADPGSGGLRSTILRMLEDGRLPASAAATLEHQKVSRASRQAYISKRLIKKVRMDGSVWDSCDKSVL